MYVRKFESETLEEALKEIKRELGPDAIILKTITNKGLKGAFKKKRIEITAAISEKNYLGKVNTEKSLNEEDKEKFYQSDSQHMSKMIDKYSSTNTGGGYGDIGLNRNVQSVKNDQGITSSSNSLGLDEFLKDTTKVEKSQISQDLDNFLPPVEKVEVRQRPIEKPVEFEAPAERELANETSFVENDSKNESRISELEKRLHQLSKIVESYEQKEPTGILQLRHNLRSLDINEFFINDLIKKISFELTDEDLDDIDSVFEFALREMLSIVNTKMPAFSTSNEESVVTVLVSDSTCGQSSLMTKLSAINKNAVYVSYTAEKQESGKFGFAQSLFDTKHVKTNSLSEVVSIARKAHDEGKNVFIDADFQGQSESEAKAFCDSVRRSFKKVEIFLTLSAIQAEVYNRKVINTLGRLADGINLTFLDKCLNFGAIFNIAFDYQNLPLCFYGTGRVIPEDIESATAERILASMFRL